MNLTVQKKDPSYQEKKEFQIQTPEAVADLIEGDGHVESANYIRNQMDHDIKLCMVDILKAATPKFARKHGYFDLFGLDFMITAENKLVLIEVNTNPAMSLDNSTLANLLPGVIDGTLDIVLRAQGPERDEMEGTDEEKDAAILASLPGRFQLLHEESSGYMYGASTQK